MIVIGCCNKDGGLYTTAGGLTKINDDDVRGICHVHGLIYYVDRSTLNVWDMRQEPHKFIDGFLAHDLHGLIYYDGSLWATDPVHDVIYELDLDGTLKGKYRWVGANKGRWHTNDIWFYDDDLWTSSFVGGICKNGQQLELGKHKQPHSIIVYDGTPYFCASNVGQVYRDRDVFCSPGGFTRGLHSTPEGLLVGSSAERNGCGGTKARVQLYDWDGRHEWTLDLPSNEVYSMTTTEMGAGQ